MSRKVGQLRISKIGWAAPSTGDLLMAPGLRMTEEKRLLRLRQKLARAKRGSVRRQRVKTAIARLKAREIDREEKAPGRVEKTKPAYTSQTCNACGHCDPKNRESQAVFRCRVCEHLDHADVNAAKNIAAGCAVTARGGRPVGRPVSREPQLVISSA
jgi:transposase